MRCDLALLLLMLSYSVSIPAGFSDALRLYDLLWCHKIGSVSIPAGFSDALRLFPVFLFTFSAILFQSLLGFLMRCDIATRRNNGFIIKFQSLLGFLMRCDSAGLLPMVITSRVSIPAGFSDALRPFLLDVCFSSISFQSLLGFLMRCDFAYARMAALVICFNPCWVF